LIKKRALTPILMESKVNEIYVAEYGIFEEIKGFCL